MINRLFIDGNDAYLQYGVYVTSGGFNELVAFPPLKSVDSNDWQEEDGVEADLSAPVLNTREIQVKFAFGGLFSRFCAFNELQIYLDASVIHVRSHDKQPFQRLIQGQLRNLYFLHLSFIF